MGLPYCDVRKFSIIDGLAANTISDIAQTPDRLMWFSTWNGISYYDGNSFHTFRDDADDIDLLSTNRFMASMQQPETTCGVSLRADASMPMRPYCVLSFP